MSVNTGEMPVSDEKLLEHMTVYKKDYIRRKMKPLSRPTIKQEFNDPIGEGFKNYLAIGTPRLSLPYEDGDQYEKRVKDEREKIGNMYFNQPLDHIAIKGDKLLEGKSVYQVEYCNVEEDIRQKLLSKEKAKYTLPEGWVIPHTTQKYDFRDPKKLCEDALKSPTVIIPMTNLGQNEKINTILNVRTGDSEYNKVIGKLGDFIVNNQMHGKIVHPQCAKHTDNAQAK